MARKTKEQAQQTRQDILMGALNVFSEKGFSRSTLSDIAKRIGMTRGAVYWHFKDKREILVELIEAMHEKETEIIAERVPPAESLDGLLEQFLVRVELMETSKEFRKFFYFMSMQVEWATEQQIFDRLRDGHTRNAPFAGVERTLAVAQQKGEILPEVDVDEVYDVILGMFVGMVRNFLSGFAKRPLSVTLESAMTAVFASIRA